MQNADEGNIMLYHCHVVNIRKARRLINTLIKSDFYIEKMGFDGVYLIFLFLIQDIHCGYSFEPPRRGGSNEPTMYF